MENKSAKKYGKAQIHLIGWRSANGMIPWIFTKWKMVISWKKGTLNYNDIIISSTFELCIVALKKLENC